MRYLTLTLLAILISSTAFSQVENYVANQLIVKFKPNAQYTFKDDGTNSFENTTLNSINESYGINEIRLTGNKKERNSFLLKFSKNQDLPELIEVYQNTGLFQYVEPNFIGTCAGQKGVLQTIPNDLHFPRQYGMHNDGSFTLSPATVDADIDMDLGWDIEQGDQSIIVAVLDAGLRMNHPEFSGRIWTNSNETLDGNDSDNNGYTDDIEGWDFSNDDNDPTDDHGHGTNVTGIIGANSNTVGYSGVDWNCQLLICKVITQNGTGQYVWWSDAIYYAVDNGANVINMSLGGGSFSSSMQDAVDYAYNNGVTVVACMMNNDNDITYYPAGYSNSIAVGATDASDERVSPFFWSASSGSNYGAHIDVVAPGNYIYGLSHSSSTNYDSYWGGTSQAAPVVAGLCALLLAQDPSRLPNDLRMIIRNTAEDEVGNPTEDTQGFDIYYGYGRVNANQALLGNTSIDENVVDLSASIYPNPASGSIFIESELEFSEIRLVNLLGDEMLTKNVSSQSNLIQLDISDLPKGIYVLNLFNSDDALIGSGKVVVE